MGLVVKDNSLINASYTLSLVEQRLILLAIIEARETGKGIDTDTFLEIHAQHYADRFHVDVKNTYAMLSDAVMTLFNRQVTYMTVDEKRNKPEKRVVRWVSGISYVEGAGIVKLRFAPEIVPLITRLEQNFTSYELLQVANLNLYATRLYELLVCWRSTGKTPIIEIGEFRSRIGLQEHEYKPMNNFKNRVLEPAIKQINEHTDITAAYEQHKKGRVITGFSFKFKQKKKTEPKTLKNSDSSPSIEKPNPIPANIVKQPENANMDVLEHRKSKITGAIMANGLADRFKRGDESVMDMMKRIKEEISTDAIADQWQNKLEEFGVVF